MEPGHLGGIAILNADDVMLNIMGRITHNDEYYAMNHDVDAESEKPRQRGSIAVRKVCEKIRKVFARG